MVSIFQFQPPSVRISIKSWYFENFDRILQKIQTKRWNFKKKKNFINQHFLKFEYIHVRTFFR